MVIELDSTLYDKPAGVLVDTKLARFAGLAYGDGYPQWGEIRVVTSNQEFKDSLVDLVKRIALENRIGWRAYTRPRNISDNPQHTVALDSTLIRRAFFDDMMQPRYDSMHSVAMEEDLAPHFQSGISDAEGSLLPPVPIESPHGRIFAMVNSDRRLLGISRLSLVSQIRLEPSSVRTRLSSHRGRKHETHGVTIVTRKNSYLIEILSGGKKKWLERVGTLLKHPQKSRVAADLLRTYDQGAGR